MARKQHNALVNKTWSRGWEPDDPRPLLEWLNSPAAEPAAVRRVTQLIEVLGEIGRADEERAHALKLSDGLWSLLRRYERQMASFLTGPPFRFGFRPKSGPVVTVRVGDRKGPYGEGDAVITVQRLAEKELVQRLQRCADTRCGKWIFVRFVSRRQRFCSKRHQERHYKTSPKFLAARRIYMKRKMAEYRARDREQDAKFFKKQRQPQRKTNQRRKA